jgi:methylthioribulose-1-phosphate dehydratase
MSEPRIAYTIRPDSLAAELCGICRLFGERQWCLATSGNFSARIDDTAFLITQSGKDKSSLTPDDLMTCDMHGVARIAELKPSAETALHQSLYRHDDRIGAVLHTHSVAATALSRRLGETLSLSGYEMQKAFAGIDSHEALITVPVFDNTQDMPALAAKLRAHLEACSSPVPAFLIRGHGLYAWGRDLSEAKRHTEAMEFLLSCVGQDMLADQP